MSSESCGSLACIHQIPCRCLDAQLRQAVVRCKVMGLRFTAAAVVADVLVVEPLEGMNEDHGGPPDGVKGKGGGEVWKSEDRIGPSPIDLCISMDTSPAQHTAFAHHVQQTHLKDGQRTASLGVVHHMVHGLQSDFCMDQSQHGAAAVMEVNAS